MSKRHGEGHGVHDLLMSEGVSPRVSPDELACDRKEARRARRLASMLSAMSVGVCRATVARHASMQRLLRERQLMEQIIETIPDPVFVRNAERELVLTNEAGRQFENATGYDTEPIVRQELATLVGSRGTSTTSSSSVGGSRRRPPRIRSASCLM